MKTSLSSQEFCDVYIYLVLKKQMRLLRVVTDGERKRVSTMMMRSLFLLFVSAGSLEEWRSD